MRAMFVSYLLIISLGLIYLMVIGARHG